MPNEISSLATAAPEQRIVIDPALSAKSILLFDIDKNAIKIKGARHPEMSRPIASITKIMTVYVALKHLPSTAEITVSKDALLVPGVAGGFSAGETFSLHDALRAVMMMSSNDMATAVAEATGKELGGETFDERMGLFVREMNNEARKLGMDRTLFRNPTGLDEQDGTASNYSTAEDLARLIVATRSTPALWEASHEQEYTIVSNKKLVHHIFNLNSIINEIPHFIGSKTGTTDTAGESLVLLYEHPSGTPEAMVLLGADPGKRFPEASSLLQKSINMLR